MSICLHMGEELISKIRNHKYSHILLSVAIQSIGTLSSFVVVLLIARFQGVIGQGEFIKIKSYFDVFIVIGLAGLPQSFIYFINKSMATRKRFFKLSIPYVVGFVFVAFVFMILAYSSNLFKHLPSIGILSILLISSIGYILHGLWRGLYITFDAKTKFAILTILPSIFLVVTTLIFIYIRDSHYEFLFLSSSLLLLVASYLFIKPSILNDSRPVEYDVSIKELSINGLFVFIHSMMLSLQVLSIYYLLEYFGGDSRDIAFFGSSYYIYQIPAILLGMLSPLLFNFILTNSHLRTSVIKTSLLITAVISLVSGIVIYLFAQDIIVTIFGISYSSAVPIMQILSLGILPFVLQRIIMVYIDSQGEQKQNAIFSTVKLVIFISLSYLFFNFYHFPNILSVSYGYIVAEYLILCFYLARLYYFIKGEK